MLNWKQLSITSMYLFSIKIWPAVWLHILRFPLMQPIHECNDVSIAGNMSGTGIKGKGSVFDGLTCHEQRHDSTGLDLETVRFASLIWGTHKKLQAIETVTDVRTFADLATILLLNHVSISRNDMLL